jgi:molecular chaperone HscC
MVYGLQKRDDGARYLILDLGGGTFDVTLVEYFAGVLEVHASAGDNFLGGEDFLQALVDAYCQAQKLDKENLPKDQQQKLKEALEVAKHALSSQHEAVVQPVLSANHDSWQIDRSQFEKLVAPLLNRVQLPVERALMDSGVAIGDIDEIVPGRLVCRYSARWWRRCSGGCRRPRLIRTLSWPWGREYRPACASSPRR